MRLRRSGEKLAETVFSRLFFRPDAPPAAVFAESCIQVKVIMPDPVLFLKTILRRDRVGGSGQKSHPGHEESAVGTQGGAMSDRPGP